jgi:hypothetical protein
LQQNQHTNLNARSSPAQQNQYNNPIISSLPRQANLPQNQPQYNNAGTRPTQTSSNGSTGELNMSSSLLAKRRGDKAAAQLQFKSSLKPSAENMRLNNKWRVLEEREIAAAKSPQWRPQLANDSIASPLETPMTGITTGTTVTPTRRGNDLYLSVH